MASAKDTMLEIMRELAFERMVDQGLKDVRNGCSIDSEEMKTHIHSWQR